MDPTNWDSDTQLVQLVTEFLDRFGVVLHVLVVGERDHKESMGKISKCAVTLWLVITFEYFIRVLVGVKISNHLWGVVVRSGPNCIYGVFVTSFPFLFGRCLHLVWSGGFPAIQADCS